MPDSSHQPEPQNSPRPNRRDLFTGGLARRASDSSDADHVHEQVSGEEFGPLFSFSSNAMGCEFQILCSESARQPLASCVSDAFQMIAELESQLSIFRASSELSQINRELGVSPFTPHPVERRLFELLELATQIHHGTDGAFDITATPLSRLWKKHQQQRKLPDSSAIKQALPLVAGDQLTFNLSAMTLSAGKSGLTIDLGGIGKGYALDRLNEFLVMSNCHDFLIHGGQSSVIGCGSRTLADGTGSGPWQVGISHPLTPDQRLATVNLNGRAIGTSGSGRQSFVVDGKRYCHIIDPRTGWPADHLLSVTVLAESAVLADALATAIFVAGPDKAEKICEQFKAAAILIEAKKSPGQSVSIETIRLENDELQIVN